MNTLAVHASPVSRTVVPRRLLATAAWVLLGMIVLSISAVIPSVHQWLVEMDRHQLFDVAHQLMPYAAASTAIVAWGAALWHAIAYPQRHLSTKFLIVGLILFGNVIASFFYYFFFVLWTERAAQR